MNSRRPEQVHYIPPGRRGGSSSLSSSPVAPPYMSAAPVSRKPIDNSYSYNHHHHQRFEPSTTPPLTSATTTTTTNDNMHATTATQRGRLPRRDYDVAGMSPRVEARDVFLYRPSATKYTAASPSTKYTSTATTSPVIRSRLPEDKYSDMAPPFRSKAAPLGWMNGSQKPIRILRRDAEVEEHVTRPFLPRPVPPPGKAQFVGNNIHQLAPSTSLQERCDKYIETLHPERPDPPAQDEPYEYPYTQPCDPSTLPPSSSARPRVHHHSHHHTTANTAAKLRREYEDQDCVRRFHRLHT